MSPKRRSDLSTELALLGYMRLHPVHGYEIHHLLADPQGLNSLWRVKLSQLYAMLARLEANGFTLAETHLQGDRPPRKMYSLTTRGEQAFLSWVTSPVTTPRELRLEFMLKLFFARRESTAAATRLVDAQMKVCDTWLSGPLVAAESDETMQSRAVRQFRMGQIEATREWLSWLTNEMRDTK